MAVRYDIIVTMGGDNMREKRNVPLIVIGASIPFMWLLVWVLSRVGFFGFITSLELSEFMETLIIVLIANIPVLVFIGYGIYNAVTAPATIPKVKERMPWEDRKSTRLNSSHPTTSRMPSSA